MSKLVDRLERLEAQDSGPGDRTADRRSLWQEGSRGGRESKKVYWGVGVASPVCGTPRLL